MTDVKMPHLGHDKHLCYLNNLKFQQSNPEEYKELVKDAKFFCANCGRAAAREQNLCNPVKI